MLYNFYLGGNQQPFLTVRVHGPSSFFFGSDYALGMLALPSGAGAAAGSFVSHSVGLGAGTEARFGLQCFFKSGGGALSLQ